MHISMMLSAAHCEI